MEEEVDLETVKEDVVVRNRKWSPRPSTGRSEGQRVKGRKAGESLCLRCRRLESISRTSLRLVVNSSFDRHNINERLLFVRKHCSHLVCARLISSQTLRSEMAGPNPRAAHGAHPIHIHPARPLYRFAATGLGAAMWFFVRLYGVC